MDSNLTFLVDAFSLLGWVGAILVILGVGLEACELFVKWGKKRKFRIWISHIFLKPRRRNAVLLLKYVEPKLLPYETLGFVLLFIGLAIELIGSGTAERMQSKENAILESTNTQLSFNVEELRQQNNDEQKQVENMRVDNIAVQRQLAASIKSGLDLEAALNPRFLDPGEKILTEFKGVKYLITVAPNIKDSGETDRFSRQLDFVLSQSGWIPADPNSNRGGISTSGIIVLTFLGPAPTESARQATDAATALVKELNDNNIIAKQMTKHSGPEYDVVLILLGQKPNLAEIRSGKELLYEK